MPITFEEVLAIANSAYPDDCLKRVHEGEEEVGDTLALFIVRELDTWFAPDLSSDFILAEGISRMNIAIKELQGVRDALQKRREELETSMKAGQKYKIRNTTLGGIPVIEGVATLIKKSSDQMDGKAERWLVRFDGEDGGKYERWVWPEDRITGKGPHGKDRKNS